MNDYSSCVISTKMPSVSVVAELNNNSSEHVLDGIYRPRSESRASTISSASSNETSEDIELPDLSEEAETKENTNSNETQEKPRLRSMSDGSPVAASPDESFEVFPSLPDSVLEKMGLMGQKHKDRLSEEESEQKFVALALAFSIDATTIKDRLERQKRCRDQTEKNLSVEIDRLLNRVYRLQILCVDAETTEMLTDLLTQVDVAMRAAAFACLASERFGAVQHEDRLSQSVELMVQHVTLLKQQRDAARKHLQYTKRMLQNTHNLNDTQTLPNLKGKTTHSRRASIAIINQHQQAGNSTVEVKKITRRTSELSIRASALPRTARPNRLELGVDLVKIKEGPTEETSPTIKENSLDAAKKNTKNEPPNFEKQPAIADVDVHKLTFRRRMSYEMKRISGITTSIYNDCSNNGILHEMCMVLSLLCFSLSIITFGNILLELKYARCNDCYSWNVEDIIANIFRIKNTCDIREESSIL